MDIPTQSKFELQSLEPTGQTPGPSTGAGLLM